MAEWNERGKSLEDEDLDGQADSAVTEAEKSLLLAGMTNSTQAEDTPEEDPPTEDSPAEDAPEENPSTEDAPVSVQSDEEEMNAMIEQLCMSKAEEFRLIGYEHVNGQDIWECVSDKYHKKGTPPLYQVVNDILSLKVTQFMNYITLNMYRGDHRG